MRPSFLCWIARHKLATIYHCSNCVVVCIGCAAEGLRAKYTHKKTDLNVAYIFLFRKKGSHGSCTKRDQRELPPPLFALCSPEEKKDSKISFLFSCLILRGKGEGVEN